MPKLNVRLHTVLMAGCTVIALGSVVFTTPASAQEPPKNYSIANQDLGAALRAFAIASGKDVIFDPALVKGKAAHGVQGQLSDDEALQRLLTDSGLVFQHTATGGFVIRPGKVSELSDPKEPNTLSEVIVTAQKREERLAEVPIPVSVLNTAALADTGQVRIRDYYATVPGVSMTAGIYPGPSTLLSIRGINAGGGVPTVGILIDDVPFGSSYGGHSGSDFPDIDPGDLERIEVLRGPQGTLYGANSLGGLLKFVTKDPSTQGYSGGIEAGSSSVFHGSQPGFNIRGHVNVPLTDTLAVRVSGFRRQDPGYIDNPVSHINGVNEAQADGARLSALWSLAPSVSLKLGALFQEIRADGSPDEDVLAGLAPLQQNYVAGAGGYRTQDSAYSAVLKAKFAGIDLTSVTGYNRLSTEHTLDYSSAWGPLLKPTYGVTATPLHNLDTARRMTQELRLSSSLGSSFDWLLGGYYSYESEHSYQYANALNPLTLQIVYPLFRQYYFFGDVKFQEAAAFLALTYHFTDTFDVQVGGRQSHLSDTTPTHGEVLGGPPRISPPGENSNNVFTYLITPRLKLSRDLMIYARLASGFRPAQPINPSPSPGVPGEASPDKTRNYELGMKAGFFDNRLTLDASVYYIAFRDVQIIVRAPNGTIYNANGGDAKSEGTELSVAARPLPGLTLSGWLSYDNAVLTSNFPASSASYGVAGDRLPITSKWSGNLSLEQRFALWNDATGFVSARASYVGDRIGNFQGNAIRQHSPAYTQTDLRAGVEYNSWVTSMYVNNLANTRGIIGGGLDAAPTYSFTFIQPRTIGLTVTKTF